MSGKAHDNETDQKTVYGRIALGIISQINWIPRDLIPLSDSIFIWKLCKQLGRSQNKQFTNYVEAISVNVLLTSHSFVAALLQIYFNTHRGNFICLATFFVSNGK